jgi:surface antigen
MKVDNIVMQSDEKQDDILYAMTPNKRKTDGTTVPLNFRHALAAISFEVVNESPTLYIEANEITFCGAYDKGDLYFGSTTTKQYPNDYSTTEQVTTTTTGDDGTETSTTEEVTTVADYPSADCYWVIDKAAEQKEYQLVEKTDDSTWRTLLPYYKYVSTTVPTIDLSQTDADQILVIPQKYYHGYYHQAETDWHQTYVKLHCRVYYIKEPHKFVREALDSEGNPLSNSALHTMVTGSLSDGSDAASLVFGTKDGTEGFADLYVPLPDGQWKAGMKYIYRLTFGGDADKAMDSDGNSALLPMSVKAEVIDWPDDDDAENTYINIGYDVPDETDTNP